MARHLFLTGEKGVGKSTLLQKALRGYQGRVGGLRTLRTDAYCPGGWSVHLFGPGEEPIPRAENLLFVCGGPQEDTPARFDRLGCRALQRSAGCSLLVLDELGPQLPAAFWPDLLRHPQVSLLEVTRRSRDRGEVLEQIRTITKSSL